MRSLCKILVPVDFSERSTGAARHARLLAARFSSEITLLHVLVPPQYEFGAPDIGGSMVDELYRNRSERASRELESWMPDVLAGLNVRRLVCEGDPAGEIVAFAHEEQAGLIVMPTHGYGPFRRFILGSITAKVLHDADCPVWTGVHMEETPPDPAPPRSILCAIDLGPQSCKALGWAADLARDFDASLTVLHVTAAGPSLAESERWGIDVREAAKQELSQITKDLRGGGELRIEQGDPVDMICSAALEVKADLLVIGRGSAAGVFGRLRANAYAIIRQSPCAVVSV